MLQVWESAPIPALKISNHNTERAQRTQRNGAGSQNPGGQGSTKRNRQEKVISIQKDPDRAYASLLPRSLEIGPRKDEPLVLPSEVQTQISKP